MTISARRSRSLEVVMTVSFLHFPVFYSPEIDNTFSSIILSFSLQFNYWQNYLLPVCPFSSLYWPSIFACQSRSAHLWIKCIKTNIPNHLVLKYSSRFLIFSSYRSVDVSKALKVEKILFFYSRIWIFRGQGESRKKISIILIIFQVSRGEGALI